MTNRVFKSLAPLLLALSVVALAAAACNGGDAQPSASPTATPRSVTPGGDGSLSTPELVERLQPSVVHILTESASLQTGSGGVGTGIIIDSGGFIVTNNHVVVVPNSCDTPAQRITVTLSNGREFQASIVGRDVPTDLAVLKIDASGLPAATIGDSRNLQVGEDVVAMGNALDLSGGPTVTKGVVSAKDRLIEEDQCGVSIPGAIQTDASINPGNSGGPLVNMLGEVMGVTTAVIRGQAEGIGFAISMQTAQPVIEQLRENGRVERAFLGIQGIVNVNPAVAESFNLAVDRGVAFDSVVPGGPAAKAGLENGDVIVQLGGREIRNSGDLFAVLAEHRAGDKVQIGYYRGDNRLGTEITLGSQPS